MRHTPILLLLLVLASSCAGPSPALDTAGDSIPQIAVEKHTLDNGLDVLLVEDHRLPRVAVNLWYHVGPANEEPGRTGFAHLFEHMMFQQSKHVPQDNYFKMLEEAGGTDLNGTTDFDRTNYFETVPSHELELALWLESDRMGYLLDTLDIGTLENQQDVVRNERRQRTENTPFGIVEEAVYHTLFPKDHPYYASVIGSHADIQAAKLDDVRRFFKQYYSPNNASIAIVGDIDKAHALQLAAKYFGPFKRGPEPPQIHVNTPPITSERRVVVKNRVELPRLYMAWITPTIYKPGDAEAVVAASILSDGKSSRLYRRLVYDKQIAQDVVAYQYSLMLGSVFVIQSTARPKHTLDELEKEIDEALDAFRKSAPDAKEVERVQARIETGALRSLEKFGGFSGIADRINMYNHYLRNPNYLSEDLRRFRNVTPEQVRQFAEKYLTSNARVVVHGVPGEPDFGPAVATPPKTLNAKAGGEAVNPDEPWRSSRPEAGKPAELKMPVAEAFKLSNGLTVLLNQRKGIPLVSADLVFRSGSGSNPVGNPGLADFSIGMLNEGTRRRSAIQFADDVAQIGASFNIYSERDISTVSVTSMASKFPAGLDLVADAVLHPTFPEEEIERVRQSRLTRLVQLKEDPGEVADRAAMLALNGPSDPFAYPALGTEASVRALKRADLERYWSMHVTPANAAFVVSGDINKDALRDLLEKAFAEWKTSSPASAQQPAVSRSSARVIVVDKPGAQQTQLRVVFAGPPRSTPDFEAIEVMNGVLGGNFSSRINLNLREDKGYTYGAYSFFNYLRDRGWYIASAGIRTDVTAPAVRETMREIIRMPEAPVTGDELRLAKESLIGYLVGAMETNADTAGLLSNLYHFDLPVDYYSTFIKNVQAVTDRGVQDAGKKYLVPKDAIIVLVGDRKRIDPGLGKLGLGPVELRDLEGNPVAVDSRVR